MNNCVYSKLYAVMLTKYSGPSSPQQAPRRSLTISIRLEGRDSYGMIVLYYALHDQTHGAAPLITVSPAFPKERQL